MDEIAAPFDVPDGLDLRVQQMGEIMIYRLGHPSVRMELNVMIGDLLALARTATQTSLSYHPPEGADPGSPSAADQDTIGALFLGAVEADTALEAGEVETISDMKHTTHAGLRYVERTLLAKQHQVVKQVALVFGPGASGAVIGYMTGLAAFDDVEAWKERVLHSVRPA